MTSRFKPGKWRGVAAALALSAPIASGWALDAQVTPSNTSVNLDIRAAIDLSSPFAANADESTPVLALLGRGNSLLLSNLGSAGIPLTWNPVWESIVPNYISQSGNGTLTRGGSTLAVVGQPLSAACAAGSCNNSFENLVLPAQVREAIARELLSGVTVGDVLSGFVPKDSVKLSYRRDWTHAGTDPNDHSAAATIIVSPSARIEVRGGTRIVGISGSAATPPISTDAGSSVPLTINWLARIRSVGTPAPLTLRSAAVEIRALNGQLLSRLSRPLSKTLPSRARQAASSIRNASVSAESFSEQIVLPPGVATRAAEIGSRSLLVRREFSDGSTAIVAEFSMPLGTSSLAGFQVTRVDLRFTDGARTRVVSQGETLHVEADINYLGSGQLRGNWEWAPVGAGSTPLFRPLPPAPPAAIAPDLAGGFDSKATGTLVREFLNNRQRITLSSPRLPTELVGGVLLRLSVSDPDIAFQLPVLRYYVTPSTAAATSDRPVRKLTLRSPPDLAPARPGLVFAWEAEPSAAFYRYECHDNESGEGEAITGAVLPGDLYEATISPLVLEALATPGVYWCRVVAIDPDRRITAVSDTTRIRVGGTDQ